MSGTANTEELRLALALDVLDELDAPGLGPEEAWDAIWSQFKDLSAEEVALKVQNLKKPLEM